MDLSSYSLNKEDSFDKRVSWFVGSFFISSTANMTMKTVLPIPDSLWGLVSIFWGAIIMFFLVRGLRTVIKRSKDLIVFSIGLFALLVLYSFIMISLRGESVTVLTKEIAIPTLLFWLPVGIFACSVNNTEILYKTLLKSSYIITFLLVLCFIFRNNGITDVESARNYSMFFGYSASFASLFQLNEYYRAKTRFNLYLFLFQFALILIYANRGAIISIAFFIFYKNIFDSTSIVKRIVWGIIIGVVSILFFLFAEYFASELLELISGYGMESRTLGKIAEGTIDESDARLLLRGISLDMIKERPVFGWGVGGECLTISSRYIGVPIASHAFSPHNGILQHMLYFGVFLGSIVNLLLFIPVFKIHQINDVYKHSITLISCSAYFITCLISSCDLLLKPAVALYLFLYYYHKK